MSIFQIAPLNPIRFIDLKSNIDWPEIYNSRPFDLETYKQSIFDFQTNRCFFQKYQTNDKARVQIWSDFLPSCKIYNTSTGLNYVVPVTNMGLSFLPDLTFSVYEMEFDFSLYGEGLLYVEVKYTDAIEFVYLSEPIDIKETWINTVLFEVSNDENAFSIIFQHNPDNLLDKFKIVSRVEAIIDNFTPKADRIVYNDQIRNNTLLWGTPFREFRLNIGGRAGISDWLIDKINRMLACNEVSIDGEFYTASEGADWEPNRGEDYPLAGWRININPVENRFIQRLKPSIDVNDIEMILHSNNRTNVGADQVYNSIFDKYSVLHGLGIIKYSVPNPFILIGITPGGSEISGPDGFQLTETNQFVLINWVFDGDATVYISNLAGSLLDINLYYYKPYDITPGVTPVTPVVGSFIKGTVYMYEEVTPGDFTLDWEESTGLGKIGRPFEGCALMDGRNGCGNMMGRSPLMYTPNPLQYTDPSGSYTYTRGQNIGIAKHLLTIAELPPHNHVLAFDGNISDLDGTGGQQGWEDDGPTNMNTNNTGGGQYHENRGPSFGIVFFKRIVD